jgi:hypothetical protein
LTVHPDSTPPAGDPDSSGGGASGGGPPRDPPPVDPVGPASPAAGARRGVERLALAGLAILLGAGALWLYRPVAPGGWHDDGVYLLLGRALATGSGFVYAGVPGDPPAAKFPPGYPAVIAGLWRMAGEDLDRTARLASALNLLAVVGSGLALARFALRRLFLPLSWALAVGLAFGFLLDPWLFALLTLSESLAVLVTILAVDLATGVEGGAVRGGRRRASGALGMYAVAVHLRSASLPLGVAMALAGAFRGHRGRALGIGAAVVLVTFPWMVASSLRTGRIPVVLRDILGGYGGWLAGGLGEPAAFVAGRAGQAWLVMEQLVSVLAPWGAGAPPWVRWGVLPVLAAALLPGVAALWRGSRTAALLLAGLLLQAVLWPFVDRRLLLPLLPWILLAGTLGVRWWSAKGTQGVRVLAPAAGILWIAGLALSLARVGGGGDGVAAMLRGREATTAAAVAAVRDWVPPGRVVGAPELWAVLHLRTGHPVAPSAPFRPGVDAALRAGTPSEQFRLWAVAGFDALVAEGGVHDAALQEMSESCGPGAFTIPATGPGFRLIRLEWDDACRRRLVPGWGGADP